MVSHALTRGTSATFKIWALDNAGAGGAAGHGHDAAVDVAQLDLRRETERAIEDCLRGRAPIALPAGEYDTVLEAPAVAELIEWLGMIGFGAREFQQGGSPLSGRLGERISGAALGVGEDPAAEQGFAAPFDRDGVTRERVPLIERGIARGFLSDRTWAARLGSTSTGSATPASSFSEGGPAPSALVVAAGEAADTAELVSGIERGLFVRRLHYVNGMLEPRRAVMTGLTRDGTFLIEGGKITRAVGNLRFTDSLLEAFERVDGVTRGRRLVPNWWSESGVSPRSGDPHPPLSLQQRQPASSRRGLAAASVPAENGALRSNRAFSSALARPAGAALLPGARRATRMGCIAARSVHTCLFGLALWGCSSDPSAPAVTAAEDEVTFSSTDFELAPGDEKYMCWAGNLPADRQVIVREISADYGPGTHHIFFGWTLAPETEGMTECPVLFKTTWIPIYLGGVDTSPLAMPEAAGVDLGTGKQLVLQLHLQNTTSRPIVNRVTMHMKTRDPAQEYVQAGIFGLDNRVIDLPANTMDVRTSMTCKPGREMNVFSVLGHMHKHGRRSRSRKTDLSCSPNLGTSTISRSRRSSSRSLPTTSSGCRACIRIRALTASPTVRARTPRCARRFSTTRRTTGWPVASIRLRRLPLPDQRFALPSQLFDARQSLAAVGYVHSPLPRETRYKPRGSDSVDRVRRCRRAPPAEKVQAAGCGPSAQSLARNAGSGGGGGRGPDFRARRPSLDRRGRRRHLGPASRSGSLCPAPRAAFSRGRASEQKQQQDRPPPAALHPPTKRQAPRPNQKS